MEFIHAKLGNLSVLDYAIITLFVLMIGWSVAQSRKYVRSVADFLAANRTAGRFLIAISQGICGVGAISILAFWQQNYMSGFAMSWWGAAMGIVGIVVAVSGWISYRYRQTRCLTMAQFFEERYSRNFRIFSGALAFFAGIVNYGIFPAIEAHFFLLFCGIPYNVWTFAVTIALILGLSIAFVLIGGQIAVIIANFLQGMFVSVSLIILIGVALYAVGWEPIVYMLEHTAENQSLINPFQTGDVEVFNFWFFIINVIIVIYNKMSWQGTQGFNASAKNAHESKMGEVLTTWRGIPYAQMFLLIPIACHAVMVCGALPDLFPQFTDIANSVTAAAKDLADTHSTDQLGKQMMTPLVLIHIFPSGVKGILMAVMIAAALSTHASYLHSWGSIFIQDVLMPIRNKPFTPKQHMLALRLAILGVSIFAFVFSMLYTPSEAILPFMMITGAIFCGGSGAVIIGGLYWKKGSTSAAWWALITGSVSACAFILIPYFWTRDLGWAVRSWVIRTFTDGVPDFSTAFLARHDMLTFARDAYAMSQTYVAQNSSWVVDFFTSSEFPINASWTTLISMALAMGVYVIVSLMQNANFNLDKMLHRGAYAIADDQVIDEPEKKREGVGFWRYLGINREYTFGDRVLVIATYIWSFGWMFVFIIVTAWHFIALAVNQSSPFTDSWWLTYWKYFILANLAVSAVVTVWFALGGAKDLKYMFKKLNSLVRDDSDDGFVRKADPASPEHAETESKTE